MACRVKCIKFSPDGSQFAVASTEGLLLYSNKLRKDQGLFNPLHIDETVTLDNIIAKVKQEEHLTALVLALRLNEREIIEAVYNSIPRNSIELIVAHFPQSYLYKFLGMLAAEIQHGRNVEWANHWLSAILKHKAGALAGCKGELRSHLLQICQ